MNERVQVRLLGGQDAVELAAQYRKNRDYLAPFEPNRPEDFFTAAGQTARIRELLDEHERGRALPYVIEVGGRLAGRVTVTNISRGPFCSGSLGYWVAVDQKGRGVATAAVRQVLDRCFDRHGLHRVEAATLVHNSASQRVLTRNGFTLIGLAPGYLHIAGQWRDHLLYQRLSEEPARRER